MSGDAGADGAAGPATCEQLQTEADAILAGATMNNALTCSADSDCSYADNSTACTYACGELLNVAGVAALQAAIANVNASICPAFAREGCKSYPGPCPDPPSGNLAACVNGTCKSFPPQAWDSFSIDQSSVDELAIPPSCTQGAGCSLWTLTPDRTVAVVNASGKHTATLSAVDFATVDGILRGPAFRQDSLMGFACGAAPGGTWVSFDISRGAGHGETAGFDVSGCVLAGPAGNDPQRLFDVIKTY